MKPSSANPDFTSESLAITLEADAPSPAPRALLPSTTTAHSQTPRCAFTSLNGRRCRMLATSPDALFCPHHAYLRLDDPDSINLAPLLLGKLKELNSARDIQRVLSNLFILTAQNRISTKRAAVLTYMLQNLIRTLPAIDHELNPAGEELPPEIVFDTPRPIRDPEPVVQRS